MLFDPFRDPFRDIAPLTNQLVSGVRTPASLPLDAWRAEDGYHVALDLPGIDPGSIELTVERGALTVQCSRRPAWGQGDQVLLAERPQGTFTRQIVLGDAVDGEAVAADYVDGVLHLRVPVRASAQPRRISVGRGDGGSAHQVIDVVEQGAVEQGAVEQGAVEQGATVPEQGAARQGDVAEGATGQGRDRETAGAR